MKRTVREMEAGALFALLAVLFVVVLVGGCEVIRTVGSSTVTFTVQRLDDQPTRHGHQYLVFTNRGVYKDTDTLLYFKYNSSDLFNQLQVGHRYRCHTWGARIPVFSSYSNLISCTPLRPQR